ncbi:MAG: SGNH/GDSL hydrolase family protein, partial [Pseudomonadota bacterium]
MNETMLLRAALSWIMLPVYIWQGLRVRMRIERLLPADVPVRGVAGSEYDGRPVKLLIIGDSTVASVGMEQLQDTFAYNIAQAVARHHKARVEWRAAGANSATSGEIRDYILPHIEDRDWTHIFVSVGINDMKNFHLVGHFKRNFGTLLYALRTRFPDAKLIWTPIPNMRQCPALPKMLAEVLSARADVINAMGHRMCAERQASATDPVRDVDASCFARDGFHPNGKGYGVWAEHVVPWFALDDEIDTRKPLAAVTPVSR